MNTQENISEPVQSTIYQTSVDVKLDYIQRDIRQIQGDLSTIKNDFINRREFNEAIKTLRDESDSVDHEDRIRNLEQFKWQLVGGLLVFQGLADYILYIVLKK